VRPQVLLFPILLAACNGTPDGDAGTAALTQERLKFRDALTILTYHSQCPPVHPPVLDPVALEIEALKTSLQERIQASALNAELDASRKETDRQASYSNESDCVGVAYANNDKESVANYRSIFSKEKRKLLSLEKHFQSLSRKMNG
jgi:hypothetical protein